MTADSLQASQGTVGFSRRHRWKILIALGCVLSGVTIYLGLYIHHQKLISEIECVRPRVHLVEQHSAMPDVKTKENKP